MALAPNVKFELEQPPLDFAKAYSSDLDSYRNTPDPVHDLPSSPTSWVPLLNFVDRAKEVAERLSYGSHPMPGEEDSETASKSTATSLPEPPHRPLTYPDISADDSIPTSVDDDIDGSSRRKELPATLTIVSYMLDDLRTLPVQYLVIALALVTVSAYLLAEVFESLWIRSVYFSPYLHILSNQRTDKD